MSLPIFSGAFAALWLAPFLFNATYVGRYYVWLAWAPLATGAAGLLEHAAGSGKTPSAVLLAAALLLVPWHDLRRSTQPTPENRSATWLAELGRLVGHRPEPTQLAIEARCPTPSQTRRSTRDLAELLRSVDGRSGVSWVTGWRRVEVVQSPDGQDADLRVLYCRGQPMHVP
jgi:hypothetical protein